MAQAKRLEAEAAFRELGEKPSIEDMNSYRAKYPDSHLAEQVQMRLLETKLNYYIQHRHQSGLKRLKKESTDEAILERTGEAYDYLAGARVAILKLERGYFENYLQRHPGGEFAKHARITIKWMKSSSSIPQRKIPVVLDGHFPPEALASIRRRFLEIRVRPEFLSSLGSIGSYEGKVIYRFTEFVPGRKRQLYDKDGKLFEFSSDFGGVTVEILKIIKGKVKPIWLWGTAKLQGVHSLEFPVVNRDTTDAVLFEQKRDSILGQIENFGRYILVTTQDGFELYDPSFPDILRPVYQYLRPATSVRGIRKDVRQNVAVKGKLVALYGQGVELLDCRSLSDIKMNTSATFARVGEVVSGVFVGKSFFFTTERGLFEIDMDSRSPKQHAYGKFSIATKHGNSLIVGADDGLASYQMSGWGGLSERGLISALDFPENFNPDSPILDSLKMRRGLLLINGKGETAIYRDEDLSTKYIGIEDIGKVYKVDGSEGWLVTLGEGGLSVQARRGITWKVVASAPIYGCQGVKLRYPMAYVICGEYVRVVHTTALKGKR